MLIFQMYVKNLFTKHVHKYIFKKFDLIVII